MTLNGKSRIILEKRPYGIRELGYKMLHGKCQVIIISLFLSMSVVSLALTDAELIAVRDGFDARRDSVLYGQIADPYPDSSDTNQNLYAWNRLDFALSAMVT